MKKQIQYLSLVLTLLVFTATANAKTKKHEEDVSKIDDITIILPYGSSVLPNIPQSTQKADISLYETGSFSGRLEVGVSSWAPRKLSLDSRLPDTTRFAVGNVPQISLTQVSSPLIQKRWGAVMSRLGLSYLSVSRKGTVQIPGAPALMTEQAHVFPFEIGVEVRPAFLQWRRVGIFTDLSALPTLMFTTRSAFDDGRTLLGIAGRGAIGAFYDVQGLIPSAPLFITLDAFNIFGTVSEGQLNGSGLQAGVRIQL